MAQGDTRVILQLDLNFDTKRPFLLGAAFLLQSQQANGAKLN